MSEQLPNDAARSVKAQRLRICFARGPEAVAIGHLDIARVWERALEAAGIVVSRSQGNRAQPRLTLAVGLPMGVTSAGELLDVVLAQLVDPSAVSESVSPHLPPGLSVVEVREVGMGLPSLPAAVRWADYEIEVPVVNGVDPGSAVDALLAAERYPWRDTRGEKVREYDLRTQIQDVRVDGRCGDALRLSMRLRCDASGVGRPDQVVKALGLPEPLRVHRRRLVLAEVSPARDAWRRRGRFVE